MSDQLLRAINKVQSEIAKRPGAFKREQQTIRSLIDPILNALGWHTYDPECVEHEFPVGNNQHVDMALKRNGRHIALLEAKPLGTRFGEKEINQVSGYCFHTGVETALLTNGAEWRVYRPQQLGKLPFNQRQLLDIRLGKDEATAAAAAKKLNLLAYDNIDRLENEAWRILLESYWNEHAAKDLLEPFTRPLLKSFAMRIEKRTVEIPIDVVRTLLSEKLGLERRPTPPQPKPYPLPSPIPNSRPTTGRSVVLAGKHIPIKYAKDVLIQTAEWLVENGKIQPAACPIRPGRGVRYLIHTRDQHSHGRPFASPKTLSNGLFLECHFSAYNARKHSFNLLRSFGYTPPEDTLQVFGFDN